MSYLLGCSMMMMIGLLSIPLSVVMQSSDATGKMGGACSYEDYEGEARILAVRSIARSENDCKDPVEIIFVFSPKTEKGQSVSPSAGKGLKKNLFLVGDGKYPSKSWSVKMGLLEGSVHPCIYSKLKRGVCAPDLFKFPQIDMSSYEGDCY